MKNFLTILFVFFNFIFLFAQMPISNSSRDCDQYNSYLQSEEIDLLKEYTTDIKPTGILTFDGTAMNDVDSVEDLFPLLNIDNNMGFELIEINQSRLNENHIYSRYQQTYNGIDVEGGGFTTVTFGAFHTGGDPCDKLIALSTYLINGIAPNTQPAISEKMLKSILKDHHGLEPEKSLELASELIISSIGRSSCEFGLTWKNRYVIGNENLAYVDASTGEILNVQEQIIGINAPTEIFGVVDLLDTENDNYQTDLIYTNGNTMVKTHDFNGAPIYDLPYEFTSDLIPATYNLEWTESDASKSVFQAHHVVTSCLPAFESLGINFTSLYVGANFVGSNALVIFTPGELKGDIYFGEKDGYSFALHDIAAHEMGHIYVRKFVDYNTVETVSISEAYADILGTYAEYYVNGGPNWWMGDEVLGIRNAVNRNLANPQFGCMFPFYLHPDGAYPHDRSQPLSHWFYLLSEGFELYDVDYAGIGIDNALNIALEILYLIGPQGDYEEIREAASHLLYEHYGVCSTAMQTASAAFVNICMDPFDYPFNPCFTVSGQGYRCEEWTEPYILCPVDAPQGLKYRWTILDSQGVNWNAMNGTQTGNSIVTGPSQPCIYFDYIPDYNQYPREIKISVYPLEHGPDYTQVKRLTLLDCDGSTDPCNGVIGAQSPETELVEFRIGEEDKVHSIKVFDLMGRELYAGLEETLEFQRMDITGIVVMSYYNKQNEFIKSEKKFINK